MTADFITVFEMSRWSNGVLARELSDLAIGVIALLCGLAGSLYILRKRAWRSLVPVLLLTAWAVSWLHDLPRSFRRLDRLISAYESGRCEASEGVVEVRHEQPAHGHASGDRVVVGGREFEVNYFYATPAYRQTIAHGGVLRAGAYVRLCHVDGEIARIELRRARGPEPAGEH